MGARELEGKRPSGRQDIGQDQLRVNRAIRQPRERAGQLLALRQPAGDHVRVGEQLVVSKSGVYPWKVHPPFRVQLRKELLREGGRALCGQRLQQTNQ